MQILKPEIRNKILFVAEQIFYKKGFSETSTREIAKEVDISVSNLYCYFLNKEDLFNTIIDEYYKNFTQRLQDFFKHQDDVKFLQENATRISQFLYEIVKSERKKFVILFERSNKTKYALFKSTFIENLENHIRSGVNSSYKDEYIISVLTRNFLNGIIDLAYNYKNDEWLYSNIKLLVDYHITGISIIYK
jgi:AcrR family transcriptional regulator